MNNALLTNNEFLTIFLVIILALYLGYLVFSLAIVRARILPRWGLWLIVLLIIGFLSLFGAGMAYVSVLLGEALLGIDIAGWGYALLSAQGTARISEGQNPTL